MYAVMITVTLPAELEEQLQTLASRVGQDKNSFARQVILEALEDADDAALAASILEGIDRDGRQGRDVTTSPADLAYSEGGRGSRV